MVLETEIASLRRIESLPHAETWREALAGAVHCLRRWVPSADTFGLWVSDYNKLCKLINELNGQTEHLSWIMGSVEAADDADSHFMIRAIDHAVDRIAKLTGSIDAELRHSAFNAGGNLCSDMPTACMA